MFNLFTAKHDNSGVMASFSFDSRAGSKRGVYVIMRRQTSWDNTKKRGGYRNGEECTFKLSDDEVAEMIKAIEKNENVKFSHFTQDAVTIINFCQHPSTDKAYVLSVSRTDKKTANKSKFSLGISKGDYTGNNSRVGQLYSLKLFLEFALTHIFSGAYSEYLKNVKEFSRKGSSVNDVDDEQDF